MSYFLLALLSNCVPILHCFWDMARYRSEIANCNQPNCIWRPCCWLPQQISRRSLASES